MKITLYTMYVAVGGRTEAKVVLRANVEFEPDKGAAYNVCTLDVNASPGRTPTFQKKMNIQLMSQISNISKCYQVFNKLLGLV